MDACLSGPLGIGWLPGPFLKIKFKSLTISNTSAPVRVTGFLRGSSLPLKCLSFFLKGCLDRRKWWLYGYTFFLHLSRYILSVWSKQCVHALYPLFDYPKMLLRAGQSLMVMKSNARSQIPLVCTRARQVYLIRPAAVKVHQLMALGTHQCCCWVALDLG
jgi:hypothetical protein